MAVLNGFYYSGIHEAFSKYGDKAKNNCYQLSKILYDEFGFTTSACAAVAACIPYESSWNPQRIQGTSSYGDWYNVGYGLIQWTNTTDNTRENNKLMSYTDTYGSVWYDGQMQARLIGHECTDQVDWNATSAGISVSDFVAIGYQEDAWQIYAKGRRVYGPLNNADQAAQSYINYYNYLTAGDFPDTPGDDTSGGDNEGGFDYVFWKLLFPGYIQ